jgi:tetratricopeptide (TPR) repeat protein
VIVHEEVNKYGMVVDPGCMKCMDCVSVCPNDALYFGFGKPAIGVPQKAKKNFQLTWPEEIAGVLVFIASYFAVWDVYQLVPMLMALGIASITTFITLKVWKLFTSSDSTFYKYSLRSSGAIRPAGWAFLGIALLWVGVNAHSGFVRYHESRGARAFEDLRIPDELALADADPSEWFTANDKLNIDNGRRHLEIANNYGLFTNDFALPKLAWIEYLSGNGETAVELLGRSAANQTGQPKALSQYYRGAILNRLGRYEGALESLDKALIERPDLVLAREERGVSLWQLGRNDEAIIAWKNAIENNPGLPLAGNFLAGALSVSNQNEKASEYLADADKNTPKDPYFHWMLGLRLKEIGMNELAESHFQKAVQLDPAFMLRRTRNRDLKKN